MMEEYLRSGKPYTESSLCKEDLRDWEETAQRWTRLVAIGVVSNETQQKLVLVITPHLEIREISNARKFLTSTLRVINTLKTDRVCFFSWWSII